MGACLLQAEIISVDKNYSADKSVMDPDYKPKVGTAFNTSCCGRISAADIGERLHQATV